jgi:SAM-dependent methyltransferase
MLKNRYIIRGGVAGRERLRVLARASQPTSMALLDRCAIGPGMNCLDVGCGGGDVTSELARRALPGGRATGIDMDETKVELARDEARRAGLDNVEYWAGDFLDIKLPREYDAIYVRFLLSHVKAPAAAVEWIAAGLREGGVLIVEDVDFTGCFCHPASEAYERYTDLYARTAHARGVDPNIGPGLPALLAGAGLDSVHVNVVQPTGFRPEGLDWDIKALMPLTLANIADSAIAEGLATRDEVEVMLDELNRLAADPSTVMATPRIVQSWGYRTDVRVGAPDGR